MSKKNHDEIPFDHAENEHAVKQELQMLKHTAKSTNVATTSAHDYDYDPELDGHGGDDDNKDFRPPFVRLLQALSPEVTTEDHPLKVGDFVLSGQKKSIAGKDGFVFLPCYHEKMYVEWRSEEAGGGIANRYRPTDPAIKQYVGANGKIELPNGNSLIETVYLYGILDDGDELPACVVTFKSTQLRPWSQMTTRRRQIFHGRVDSKHPSHVKATSADLRVIPGFAVKWRFKSIQEAQKTDAKKKFYNYDIGLEGETKDKSCLIDPGSVAYLKAKDLRSALNAMRSAGADIASVAGEHEVATSTESTYE